MYPAAEVEFACSNLLLATVEAARETLAATPVVGEGATVHRYSDAHAFTVVSVSPSGKTCQIRRDRAELLNGVNSGAADALTFEPGGFVGHTYGVQRYSYARDEGGAILTARLTKRGWRADGCRVVFGVRAEHYDYNF